MVASTTTIGWVLTGLLSTRTGDNPCPRSRDAHGASGSGFGPAAASGTPSGRVFPNPVQASSSAWHYKSSSTSSKLGPFQLVVRAGGSFREADQEGSRLFSWHCQVAWSTA